MACGWWRDVVVNESKQREFALLIICGIRMYSKQVIRLLGEGSRGVVIWDVICSEIESNFLWTLLLCSEMKTSLIRVYTTQRSSSPINYLVFEWERSQYHVSSRLWWRRRSLLREFHIPSLPRPQNSYYITSNLPQHIKHKPIPYQTPTPQTTTQQNPQKWQHQLQNQEASLSPPQPPPPHPPPSHHHQHPSHTPAPAPSQPTQQKKKQ